jgi:hypothetical protein
MKKGPNSQMFEILPVFSVFIDYHGDARRSLKIKTSINFELFVTFVVGRKGIFVLQFDGDRYNHSVFTVFCHGKRIRGKRSERHTRR